jgi:hypothetical protein
MRFGRDEAGTMYFQVRMDHAARAPALLDDHAHSSQDMHEHAVEGDGGRLGQVWPAQAP